MSFFANIRLLFNSPLFRRQVITWGVLWAFLLIILTAVMVYSVNSIYHSNENEHIERTVEMVEKIRTMVAADEMERRTAVELQRQLCNTGGMSIYVYLREGKTVKFFDRTSALVEIEDEAETILRPYAERLWGTEEHLEDWVTIDGTLYLMHGRLLRLSDERSDVVICLDSAANAQKQQRLITLAVCGAVLLVTLVGFLAIMKLTSRYTVPFTNIAQAAIDMSEGDLNTRVDGEDEPGEVGLLARSFNRLSSSLSQSFIQLEQERSKLMEIVDSSSNGIAVTDENGELIQYNPALTELFSQKLKLCGSVDEKDPKLAVVPDASVWERFDAVKASCKSERLVYPLDDDCVLWINIYPVISAENKLVGVVGHFQDMTELERLERTRREYVANVSHELRRPLTALQGLLEPIRDGLVESEGDKQRYYDIMLKEIKRLTRLITDMMQLSRLQSDWVVMHIEPIDVSDIVREMTESYRAQIESAGLTLTVDAPDGLFVMADADRVEQVLIILIDNAINYNCENGRIEVVAGRDDEDVSIVVSNTGFGISEADAPHIFDRFYTAKVAPPSVEGSTGLGLNIARTIMEKMGGDITCVSSLGGVTSMRVTFKKGEVPFEGEAVD